MTAEVQNTHKWDLVVRTCHWLMVILVTSCWYTAEYGDMQWHYYSGYALLAVVIIRIVWGFVGPTPARFGSFIKPLKKVVNYLKTIRQNGEYDQTTHSPAGGYSVLVLLSLMLTQTTSGLFAVETDGYDGGPLSELIDYDLSLQVSEFHQFNFDLLLCFIGLHLIAVGFYQWVLKKNLLKKMRFFG